MEAQSRESMLNFYNHTIRINNDIYVKISYSLNIYNNYMFEFLIINPKLFSAKVNQLCFSSILLWYKSKTFLL